MSTRAQLQHSTAQPSFSPVRTGLLQRKCACGGTPGPDGECAACRQKRLQRQASSQTAESVAPPSVHNVLRSAGQPLDSATRAFMEPRFGHNFSSVRVHTDTPAVESAQSVSARAFTVGSNIVFGAGQYTPATATGRQLLAHELAHVVQQGFGGAANRLTRNTNEAAPTTQAKLKIGQPGDVYEQEADLAAERVMRMSDSTPQLQATSAYGEQHEVPLQRAEYGLYRNGGGQPQSPPQPVTPVAPTQQQMTVIENARGPAAIRTQVALFRLRGTVPPGPAGRPDPGEAMRRRALALARVMFDWADPNMDQIEEIVGSMVSRLINPQVMVAGRNDPECGNRAAYVRGLRPPMILCPTFFSDTPEQQTRTLIHEAAHLARIGSATLGESYCVIFDCETSCGGFDSADSWAQFVHCLSGQAADQPTVIQGQPGGTGQRPGSGGTP